MKFQVEIGVWKISQDHESKTISFFKYGRVVSSQPGQRLLNHTELYNILSEFVVRRNQEEGDE